MKKLLASTALMFGALFGSAFAGPSGTIQYSVAVCDPNSPFHCSAPDVNGAFPVTFSGSPIVTAYANGKATAAAPTYVEGSFNPVSLDLSGNLRTVISGSLPAGSNTIGAVTQASGPWTSNVTQFGSSAVVTGTGAGGAGIPRVTVSNDSTVGLVAGTATIGSLNPLAGTYTSKNLTLTTGGTAQTLIASNASRRKFYIQNPCTAAGQGIAAVESIYISFTGSAGVNNGTSIEILACGSYESDAGPISTQAISVNAATTNHKIVAGEM